VSTATGLRTSPHSTTFAPLPVRALGPQGRDSSRAFPGDSTSRCRTTEGRSSDGPSAVFVPSVGSSGPSSLCSLSTARRDVCARGLWKSR